jgi:hypothetical protein
MTSGSSWFPRPPPSLAPFYTSRALGWLMPYYWLQASWRPIIGSKYGKGAPYRTTHRMIGQARDLMFFFPASPDEFFPSPPNDFLLTPKASSL